MSDITVAIVSFPGMNCEVESIRAVERAGMRAMFFRWNDDQAKLNDVDAYFLPGGFSYEDRGRAGMIAARDPLMEFLKEEARLGKVVIGHCNGAQILVESGLIPLGEHLDMALAPNAKENQRLGFLSEWVWITPTCTKERCAVSDWDGAMHVPIAHGEGRWTLRDRGLLQELCANHQVAFSYCDAQGKVGETPMVNPNGSELAIAGLCNPSGNVVALMPHPERTPAGGPYFASLKLWIERYGNSPARAATPRRTAPLTRGQIDHLPRAEVELFIDTVIVNNEERSVEATLKRFIPDIHLKQFRYCALPQNKPHDLLSRVSFFNPNKEVAYIRRNEKIFRWDHTKKSEVPLKEDGVLSHLMLVRYDDYRDNEAVCYALHVGDEESLLSSSRTLEVLCNPHSGTLYRLL